MPMLMLTFEVEATSFADTWWLGEIPRLGVMSKTAPTRPLVAQRATAASLRELADRIERGDYPLDEDGIQLIITTPVP